MRRKFFCTAAALTACLSLVALARAEEKRTKVTDREFVTEVAGGGLAEVKLGELAKERAASPEVRKFGERMIDDHNRANQELMALLRKKGMDVSTKEMPKKAQETFDRLSQLKGAEFDRAYIKDMLKDHREDVALFEAMSKSGSDPDLRAFAIKTLPTLREHYQLARKLAGESTNR
jgi:putative membrane protein